MHSRREGGFFIIFLYLNKLYLKPLAYHNNEISITLSQLHVLAGILTQLDDSTKSNVLFYHKIYMQKKFRCD